MKAAEVMYQIVVVRHNRQKFTETGPIEERPLNSTTDEKYQALHGSREVGRITHMQYVACGTAVATILHWMKEPLGSKWVKIAYDNEVAELEAPVEVDRWSYNKEQRITVTIAAGSQDLYFEMVEYEVKKTTLKPKRYLKILPNGQATFIEAPS